MVGAGAVAVEFVGWIGRIVCDGKVELFGNLTYGIGVSLGEGTGRFGFGAASGFGVVKKGSKVIVPKVKSFLKSWIELPMAVGSVVPHQLFEQLKL